MKPKSHKAKLVAAILSYWAKQDEGFMGIVNFDACDRERISRELAEHITKNTKPKVNP